MEQAIPRDNLDNLQNWIFVQDPLFYKILTLSDYLVYLQKDTYIVVIPNRPLCNRLTNHWSYRTFLFARRWLIRIISYSYESDLREEGWPILMTQKHPFQAFCISLACLDNPENLQKKFPLCKSPDHLDDMVWASQVLSLKENLFTISFLMKRKAQIGEDMFEEIASSGTNWTNSWWDNWQMLPWGVVGSGKEEGGQWKIIDWQGATRKYHRRGIFMRSKATPLPICWGTNDQVLMRQGVKYKMKAEDSSKAGSFKSTKGCCCW